MFFCRKRFLVRSAIGSEAPGPGLTPSGPGFPHGSEWAKIEVWGEVGAVEV